MPAPGEEEMPRTVRGGILRHSRWAALSDISRTGLPLDAAVPGR